MKINFIFLFLIILMPCHSIILKIINTKSYWLQEGRAEYLWRPTRPVSRQISGFHQTPRPCFWVV